MLTVVRFWILFSTLLVSTGWILSALHQLNRAGYAVIFALAGTAFFFWQRKNKWRPQKNLAQLFQKFRRRFKRPAPCLFLLLAMLALLSGALYPALNYDANSYRLPRVFHWLAAGQWHWIHTFDARMNIAACGMEWLSAPLILFSHTDRLLFLINWISYLMLPGLIFSVFTRLQVRPRVAWWWMWFLAAGWCFVLQAGSIGNDSFAAVYILAAVDLALRAREKKSATDLWLSVLAAALATGAKQTNIPLVTLWLIAAWLALPLFWKNPLRTAVVASFALLVSIVPISVLNYQHCGIWLPLQDPALAAVGKFQLNPFWGVIGNAFCIPAQNLLPPFYNLLPPFYEFGAQFWNELMTRFLQTPFGTHFTSFEKFGFVSNYYHGVSEGNAGIGFGASILTLVSVFELLKDRRPATVATSGSVPRLLRLASWAALLVFMAKVGTFENARQMAAYYVFLFPLFLIRDGNSRLVRRPDWQRLGLLTMLLTGVLLAIQSERPLFPAKTIFRALHAKFPNCELVSDEFFHYLESNYQVMQARRDYLAAAVPADESVIGYYAQICNVDETGVWLPRPQRRVEDITSTDSPGELRSRGIHYVVVVGQAVIQQNGSLANWLAKYHAQLIGQYTFPRPSFKSPPPPDLYFARLD
jgi:hypothetical protein